MIKNFRHTCILVSDLKKSLNFYRDFLGFNVTKIITVSGRYPQTALNVKGARITYIKLSAPNQPKKTEPILELHYWENPKLKPRKNLNHISLTVNKIESEYNRLCRLGVKFISSPIKNPYGNTKLCFAYDPDKNLIEFIEDL